MRLREVITGTPAERAARQAVKDLKAKDRLNKNQQRALDTSRKISRRAFLRGFAAVGGAVLVPGAGALLFESTRPDAAESRPTWLTIEGEDIIGPERVKEAITAAKEWDEKYGVKRKIKISPLDVQRQEFFPNGAIATQEEVAGPGYIQLGKLGSNGNTRSTMLHALSHALQPDKPTFLQEPLTFSAGAITAIHGLNVLATDKNGVSKDIDGKDLGFSIFEEAMAERNALAFPGYFVSDPRYQAVGDLARKHVPFDKYPNAHEWSQTNNLSAFIRAALSLSTDAQISVEQIEQVMLQYDSAWKNAS